MTAPTRETRHGPRLARGVRLHDDRVRGQRVLLLPERVVRPDEHALEVLERLDGRPTEELVAELAAAHRAPLERVRADVAALLEELDAIGALTWSAP